MSRAFAITSSLTLLLLLGSCRANPASPEQTPAVYHLVVCWLKQPGDETARQRIIDESRAFVGVIPGLIAVRAGAPLPSDRPVVDSTYDVAIVMSFADEAALRDYDVHPAHKAAVERTLRPLVDRVVIYDFVAQ